MTSAKCKMRGTFLPVTNFGPTAVGQNIGTLIRVGKRSCLSAILHFALFTSHFALFPIARAITVASKPLLRVLGSFRERIGSWHGQAVQTSQRSQVEPVAADDG